MHYLTIYLGNNTVEAVTEFIYLGKLLSIEDQWKGILKNPNRLGYLKKILFFNIMQKYLNRN